MVFGICPAFAQTVVSTSGVTTTNGAGDQTALCQPADGPYPAQWTWDPSKTVSSARDATPADNLTPRIEQHRTISGTDTIVAVWSSFGSTYQCQEIFSTPPAQPAPGSPYTAAQYQPYTVAQLQAMANQKIGGLQQCGPLSIIAHVDDMRRWLPGDTFLVYPAVYTGQNNNITLMPKPDYYCGAGCAPIYSPNNITIKGVTRNGIRPVIVRNDTGSGDSETAKDVIEIIGGANNTIQNIGVTLGPNGNVLEGRCISVTCWLQRLRSIWQPVLRPSAGIRGQRDYVYPDAHLEFPADAVNFWGSERHSD